MQCKLLTHVTVGRLKAVCRASAEPVTSTRTTDYATCFQLTTPCSRQPHVSTHGSHKSPTVAVRPAIHLTRLTKCSHPL